MHLIQEKHDRWSTIIPSDGEGVGSLVFFESHKFSNITSERSEPRLCWKIGIIKGTSLHLPKMGSNDKTSSGFC